MQRRTFLDRAGRAVLVASALLTAASSFAASPSTSFLLAGEIANPGRYDLAKLQAQPAITQTVSFLSAGVPQTHTFTGASLWGIVNGAGILNNPAVRNDVLNKYVLATGSDGYKAVFSLGELNPDFGNRQSLVAYAETIAGVSHPLGADGFARTTSPGDVKGGRYVSNLVNLSVRGSGSTQAGTGGGLSTQFKVSGAVKADMTFDLAALQALPSITRTVGADTYTGVSFWDLLNTTVGLVLDPAVKNDVLGKYVVATGSDGYKSVFSLGELSPDFGNQPDMIAYALNGNPLDVNGFARVVVPNDNRRGRWVSNLVSLEVFSASAVPEPATWALMLAGLAAVVAGAAKRRSTQSHAEPRAA